MEPKVTTQLEAFTLGVIGGAMLGHKDLVVPRLVRDEDDNYVDLILEIGSRRVRVQVTEVP